MPPLSKLCGNAFPWRNIVKRGASFSHRAAKALRAGDCGRRHGGHGRYSRRGRSRRNTGSDGRSCERIFDVGVAGLHRLLYQRDALARCDVLIAVAGMEGAFAPRRDRPGRCSVIAVPTSIGYGANLGGVTAMLGMLTACCNGMAVWSTS
jgi:hypothetical protein